MVEVSVIMGVCNCEKTLSDAIESIMGQTYPAWKLIMCDDGSEDGTYSVALRYAKWNPDKMILLRNEKNMGLNCALNRCLQYADGAYVARMDGDDISHPERLEREASFLDSHPEYAVVSCPMIYFDEDGAWGRGTEHGEVKATDFIRGTPFCHAPSMVRREALAAVGGYSTDRRTLRAEDYDLWFRMYERGFKGYNLPDPLYRMRDDQKAYHRRKLKYALNEAYVRYTGYRRLKLPISAYFYVARPVLVAVLPRPAYLFFHRRRKAFP